MDLLKIFLQVRVVLQAGPILTCFYWKAQDDVSCCKALNKPSGKGQLQTKTQSVWPQKSYSLGSQIFSLHHGLQVLVCLNDNARELTMFMHFS